MKTRIIALILLSLTMVSGQAGDLREVYKQVDNIDSKLTANGERILNDDSLANDIEEILEEAKAQVEEILSQVPRVVTPRKPVVKKPIVRTPPARVLSPEEKRRELVSSILKKCSSIGSQRDKRACYERSTRSIGSVDPGVENRLKRCSRVRSDKKANRCFSKRLNRFLK